MASAHEHMLKHSLQLKVFADRRLLKNNPTGVLPGHLRKLSHWLSIGWHDTKRGQLPVLPLTLSYRYTLTYTHITPSIIIPLHCGNAELHLPARHRMVGGPDKL